MSDPTNATIPVLNLSANQFHSAISSRTGQKICLIPNISRTNYILSGRHESPRFETGQKFAPSFKTGSVRIWGPTYYGPLLIPTEYSKID